MKSMLSGGVAALALLLAGCGDEGSGNGQAAGGNAAPLQQIAAPNGDWTQTVEETPQGGYRMGNPNAPVKLVEYGSISCSHCAEFSETATEPLKNNYVKSGQVSWEFRPYLLFPTDPGITMLLRCQGPTPFFHLADQLYADQANWAGKLQNLSAADQQQIQSMPAEERAAALVRLTGVDQFFRQRGMPESKVNSCLADKAGLQRLAEITDQGNREGVTGTPTFFINGKVVTLTSAQYWRELEPQLRSAIGS
ncbi:MAG TPA: thioredoxin domain-containing protein [Allosphingosinicella sp.]|jgi:protein-disulfide isomerase